ncbi:hypothetical protein [Ancylomarina longa]|uniref:DUF4015 domain-containing protein n=1 Tax=Ancylomarina longa TaxID=2487017 RepID=A0A434AFE1_9BACT|nr:hypothetical protein [Ancylomarina longa]RUT73089.1 hypothetical protein DLK05_15275 [Ancylomarina longa]
MNKLFAIFAMFVLLSCGTKQTKIPCFAWMGGPGEASDVELSETFTDLKEKGIDGLLYNGGHDPAVYQRVGKIAKKAGLEFHAWIPTMVQGKETGLSADLYAVNGKGESAYDKPAYVDHYTFLCPNHEEVYQYLSDLYSRIAALPEVDGIHLDYMRFPDVILAKGLWDKYNLVMDKEYPAFDYCYCDKCVADFKAKTGIDIKKEKDPSQIQEWKQFRQDLITKLVNRLVEDVHLDGKEISAAVFPGPHSHAVKMVRQEWDRWNLDAFFPMNYNDFYLEGTDWIGKMCKESATSLNGERPFYSGLFICPNPDSKAKEADPENHGLLPDEIGAAVRESMENGAKGICLFTPDRMTKAHWKAFEKAIHKKYSLKN